jgi:predicted TIM-barrel fold metal-dependent hydrolase
MLPIDAFPKIDAHIHFNADRTDLLTLAEQYHFDLLTINTEVPDFPSIEEQQRIARSNQLKTGTNLHYATTVNTDQIFNDDWAEKTISKIESDISNGACGVKFWKNIGMSIQETDGSFLMLDDAKLEPVFTFLEEQQIPVLGHQGEPKNCWLPIEEMIVQSDRDYFAQHPEYHMYKHDKYPGYWEHIKARDAILQRHPSLNFVGLHLASLEWNLDEVADRLDRFPNLAVDLAERISHLYYHAAKNKERVIDFFHQYQDRIIYGTDIIDDPSALAEEIATDLTQRWTQHWQFLAGEKKLTSSQIDNSFHCLDLSRDILEKIYKTNAEDWYQL